jgi:hypothetical protein
MPRPQPLTTEQRIENRIKNGYGSGVGADYRPWLVVQDFSSLGRVHRMMGWKHRRVYHLFSDLERNVFLHYLYPYSIIDIREQFPLLPVEETVEIAREIDVRHPIDPRTKHPIVMTTDLLLTVQQVLKNTNHPRTVKYYKDLKKSRTSEKLEIERRYWASPSRNQILKIVTEKQISDAFVRNMLWVHPFYWLIDLYPLVQHDVCRIASVLTKMVLNESTPLRTLAKKCDQLLRLEIGTSLVVIRHLLATRYWEVDMNIRINTNQQLVLLSSPTAPYYVEGGV